MKLSLSQTNLLQKAFTNLLNSNNWLSFLIEGDLKQFETTMYASVLELYDELCQFFIQSVSFEKRFKEAQKELAQHLGLKKLVTRDFEIQLRTGTKIKHKGYYAKRCLSDYKGERRLSLLYWGCVKGASPHYQSVSCLFSVICPSFSVARQLMHHQEIKGNDDRIRSVSLGLAHRCLSNRADIQLTEKDSLMDKRVLIEIDGGRSRTRVYSGELNRNKQAKFDTPWREPKVFIITAIDEEGKIEKGRLPIYDTTFGDVEVFELLEQYLKKLDIAKCESVQFIADGAPWIWNKAAKLLTKLGVKKEQIIETLDYYHASEHLHEMKIYMDATDKDRLFKKIKDALWKGEIEKMGTLLKKAISNLDLENFTPYQYFFKNKEKIDYQKLKDNNRPCGSGLIESGIRRIINLRFKSPSSFWYPDNLEKLIFLRGVALAGRWNIMMENLNQQFKY